MNIVLFGCDACRQSLPLDDHRARHLLDVLRRAPGGKFRAGVVNGPTGRGTVIAVEPERIRVALRWDGAAPEPDSGVTLIVGLPRPPSAKKILYQCAAIGCRAIHFVHTHLSDRNYARSRLWERGEWRRHLLDGLQQAAATSAPEVTCGEPLLAAVQRVTGKDVAVALDNETGTGRLGAAGLRSPLVLAVGPERGWSDADRDILRRRCFTFCTLGTRILRVETACVAAAAIARAHLGEM